MMVMNRKFAFLKFKENLTNSFESIVRNRMIKDHDSAISLL